MQAHSTAYLPLDSRDRPRRTQPAVLHVCVCAFHHEHLSRLANDVADVELPLCVVFAGEAVCSCSSSPQTAPLLAELLRAATAVPLALGPSTMMVKTIGCVRFVIGTSLPPGRRTTIETMFELIVVPVGCLWH